MAIFQPVKLGWNGKDYTIPADRVLGAIAVIEEHISFLELIAATRGHAPLVAISRAFAGVLRYAGGEISDDEVYAGMFRESAQKQAVDAVNTLLVMMVPPDELNGKTVGKSSGNSQAAVVKRSGRSTKRRSQNS